MSAKLLAEPLSSLSSPTSPTCPTQFHRSTGAIVRCTLIEPLWLVIRRMGFLGRQSSLCSERVREKQLRM